MLQSPPDYNNRFRAIAGGFISNKFPVYSMISIPAFLGALGVLAAIFRGLQ